MSEAEEKEKSRVEKSFKIWCKWNCSTLFLLKPVTGIGIGGMSEYGLINSYLQDVEREYEDDVLFVLFKPENWDDFQLLIQREAESKSNFIEDYDYEGGYVVMAYGIPKEMKIDFEKFKEGKYSEISEDFKKKHDWKVMYNYETKNSFQYMVFYKDAEYVKQLENMLDVKFAPEQEMWSIPAEKEILDISEIKQKEEVVV